MLDRVGITGGSGCGVTTLGRALADRLGAAHIDTDDYHWLPTDPPYQVKRAIPERLRLIAADQARAGRWVLSGTLDDWAEPVAGALDLIVFLDVPTEIRLERLRARESARFGEALLPGGAMHEVNREFVAWAAQYDEGRQPGRSRPRHEAWLARAAVPVLRLDGRRDIEDLVEAICAGRARRG